MLQLDVKPGTEEFESLMDFITTGGRYPEKLHSNLDADAVCHLIDEARRGICGSTAGPTMIDVSTWNERTLGRRCWLLHPEAMY